MARMIGKDARDGFGPYEKRRITGGIGGVIRAAKDAKAKLAGQGGTDISKPAPVVGNRVVKSPPGNTGIVPPMMKAKKPVPQPVKRPTGMAMNPATTMSTLSRKPKLTQR